MVEQAVLVAVCSVGAGVMGLIAGLLIMFVVKSCQTDSDNTDTEKGPTYTSRRESPPREYCSRDVAFDWRRPERATSDVAPITRDCESGVYCRISKFDFPVVTEDAAVQTNEMDGDYEYLVKFEQAVQCDIITACPSQSLCDQSTTSNDPNSTMSYSGYKSHVRDAFSTWQVLPTAAMTSQPCTRDDSDWSHQNLDKCKQTNKEAGQNEAADDSDVLVIRLTSKVRTFLHQNGLCETASSVGTPITMDKMEAAGCSHFGPTTEVGPLQGSSDRHTSESGNTPENSEAILGADTYYVNSEDYLLMSGQSAEDYLPMNNLSEEDEYVRPEIKDNYSYLASLKRQTSSTKPNLEKNTQNTVAPLSDASFGCNESQATSPYSSGTSSEYINAKHYPSECVSEDEDYLPMSTKKTFVTDDYYNCSRLKHENDDEYLPIDEQTLPRGCGKTRPHSTQDSDYTNYRGGDGHLDIC